MLQRRNFLVGATAALVATPAIAQPKTVCASRLHSWQKFDRINSASEGIKLGEIHIICIRQGAGKSLWNPGFHEQAMGRCIRNNV